MLDLGVAAPQIQATELGFTAPTSSWVCAASLTSAGRADERIGGPVGSIVDRDCGSLGGEPPRDRGADSAAASGDQDPLSPPIGSAYTSQISLLL